MKKIQIERGIFEWLQSKAAESGASPSTVLRRELGVPEPTVELEVDDETYAYILSKSQTVGETASDILRRELGIGETPIEPQEPGVVEFRIRAGTGDQPWNTRETMIVATVGDTLRVFNDDSVAHRLHTSGSPFPHPALDIQPGQSADFLLSVPHDPDVQGSLYDHARGMGARFWISVLPAT